MARDTFMKTSQHGLVAEKQGQQHAFQASRDLGQSIGNAPAQFQQAQMRSLEYAAEQQRIQDYVLRTELKMRETAVRESLARVKAMELQNARDQEDYQKRAASTQSKIDMWSENLMVNPQTGAAQGIHMDLGGHAKITDLPEVSSRLKKERWEAETAAMRRGPGSAEREFQYWISLLTADKFSGVTDEDREEARRQVQRLTSHFESIRPGEQGPPQQGPPAPHGRAGGPPGVTPQHLMDPSQRTATQYGRDPQTPMDLPEWKNLSSTQKDVVIEAWGRATTTAEREELMQAVRDRK